MNVLADQKLRADSKMQIVPLHFNVPDHYLPLDEFIVAANSTRAIIENFNQKFFDGKLEYQIIVLPPEAGTFKERLGIKVSTAGVVFMLGALSPEFASGVIKGITGKSVFELGQAVGEKIVDVAELSQRLWSESLTAIFLAEATKGFFQKEEVELEKHGIEKKMFLAAYEGRNDFYEACYRNPEIQSVGFDETDNFPIQRNDFARFITAIPEEDDDEDGLWEVEITYIKVISPNWERGDNRTWKAKYGDHKEAYFVIEDDYFWGLVDAERLTLKGKDSIKVQWAYIKDGERRKKVRVLKVLEYNGAKLSPPLIDNELAAILNSFAKHTNDQRDLFEGG